MNPYLTGTIFQYSINLILFFELLFHKSHSTLLSNIPPSISKWTMLIMEILSSSTNEKHLYRVHRTKYTMFILSYNVPSLSITSLSVTFFILLKTYTSKYNLLLLQNNYFLLFNLQCIIVICTKIHKTYVNFYTLL